MAYAVRPSCSVSPIVKTDFFFSPSFLSSSSSLAKSQFGEVSWHRIPFIFSTLKMFASRTATRTAARQLRPRNRLNIRQARFATTNQQAAAAGGSSGLAGGIAGGALVFFVRLSHFLFRFYLFHDLTSSRQAIHTTTSPAQNPS